jgi:drug/metabolite transporter (DMT)-like permease
MKKPKQMLDASITCVALGALCWGLSGGIGGILMDDGWGAFVVSFYRGAVGLLFALIWLILRPYGNGFRNRWLWFWSAIAGLGVAGNFAFYFVSIEQGNIAIAASLMYCAPVFVYLTSFALKLERPTTLKCTAIAMVMLGIVLLTRFYDIDTSIVTPIGVVTGLLAGLCYAVFIFGFKNAAPLGSPQAILSIVFAVLVTILIWPSDIDQTVAVLSSPDWPLFAMLGILGAGFSFIFYVIGLNHTLPTVAAIVAMIEPVIASLFGVMILNEYLDGSQILGMGLILVTVTALGVYSNSGRYPSNSSMSREPRT